MEAIYNYAHIVHLILAIIFLGYVFSDVFVISILKKRFQGDTKMDIERALSSRSTKIFPIVLLLLIVSGGMMMSKFVNSQVGFFDTSLQQTLMLKVFLALLIVFGVVYNLYKKFTKQAKPIFMKEHFHKLVLVLGFLIVVCAKVMFLF